MEHALGTDSAIFDRATPENLQSPQFHPGGCDLSFGRNDAARPHTIWILKRSLDLSPGSFEEIYRYDGPSGVEAVPLDFSSVQGSTTITVTDLHPPDPCAFYRFEAEFVPTGP